MAVSTNGEIIEFRHPQSKFHNGRADFGEERQLCPALDLKSTVQEFLRGEKFPRFISLLFLFYFLTNYKL